MEINKNKIDTFSGSAQNPCNHLKKFAFQLFSCNTKICNAFSQAIPTLLFP